MTKNKDTSGTPGTVYGDGKLANLRKKRDCLCAAGVYLHWFLIDELNREIALLTGDDAIPPIYLPGDKCNALDYSKKSYDKGFGAVIH